jgi:hypothetical protein
MAENYIEKVGGWRYIYRVATRSGCEDGGRGEALVLKLVC